MLRSAFQVVTHEHTSTLVYVLSLFGHLLFSFLNASLYQASTCRIMWDKGQDDCADLCWGWQSAPRELWSVTWMLQKGGRDPYQFHMQREPCRSQESQVISCGRPLAPVYKGNTFAGEGSSMLLSQQCLMEAFVLSPAKLSVQAFGLRLLQPSGSPSRGARANPCGQRPRTGSRLLFPPLELSVFWQIFFISLMLGLRYKSHLLYWLFLGEWVCKIWGKQEKGDLLLI